MNTEMKKTVIYSTGDKILSAMKEQDISIPELSGVWCPGKRDYGYSGRNPGTGYYYPL